SPQVPCAGFHPSRRARGDGEGAHARGRGGGDWYAGHRIRGNRPVSETTNNSGVLSEHVKQEIDRWLAKFPPDRKRSAVIAALHAVQHDNGGYLTRESMDAVAEYLG